MKRPIIIGIAGGSASGKTLISKRLKKAFESSNSMIIIKQDDYYLDQSHMEMSERVKTNYDHPFAFDNDLLVAHLKHLVNRQAINKPTYDFVNHTRSDLIEHVESADVIVIEGLFVLENTYLRELCDIKVFVETEADIRFIRRLSRDVHQRGRSLDSVIDQYMKTVRVMHEQFIQPSKKYADVIIPEGGKNDVAIDLLTTKISSIITQNVL
jgi:uridine kinase